MKKTLFLMSLLFSFACVAQERVLTIKAGIEMIGQTQSNIKSYLFNKGFNLIKKDNRIEDYISSSPDVFYKYTVAYKNKTSTVISWNENLGNMPSILSELKLSGFESLPVNRATNIYGFKNISRKVLVTLIVQEEENKFYVTIGEYVNTGKHDIPISTAKQKSIESRKLIIKNSNDTARIEIDNDNIPIFSTIDKAADYKGGLEQFYKFFERKLVYPSNAKKDGVAGFAVIKFLVNEVGTLSDFKILRGLGHGCDEEAIRIIKLTSPWNPAEKKW